MHHGTGSLGQVRLLLCPSWRHHRVNVQSCPFLHVFETCWSSVAWEQSNQPAWTRGWRVAEMSGHGQWGMPGRDPVPAVVECMAENPFQRGKEMAGDGTTNELRLQSPHICSMDPQTSLTKHKFTTKIIKLFTKTIAEYLSPELFLIQVPMWLHWLHNHKFDSGVEWGNVLKPLTHKTH